MEGSSCGLPIRSSHCWLQRGSVRRGLTWCLAPTCATARRRCLRCSRQPQACWPGGPPQNSGSATSPGAHGPSHQAHRTDDLKWARSAPYVAGALHARDESWQGVALSPDPESLTPINHVNACGSLGTSCSLACAQSTSDDFASTPWLCFVPWQGGGHRPRDPCRGHSCRLAHARGRRHAAMRGRRLGGRCPPVSTLQMLTGRQPSYAARLCSRLCVPKSWFPRPCAQVICSSKLCKQLS